MQLPRLSLHSVYTCQVQQMNGKLAVTAISSSRPLHFLRVCHESPQVAGCMGGEGGIVVTEPRAELSTQATNVANAQLLEEYFEELNLFDFPPDAPSVEAGKEATIELSVTALHDEAGEAGIEVSVTAPHEASEADAKPCLHVSPEIGEPAAQTAEEL